MNNFQRKAEEMNMLQKFEIEHKEKKETSTKQSKISSTSSKTSSNKNVNIILPQKEKIKEKKSYLSLYLPDKDIKKLKTLSHAQGYSKLSHFFHDLIKQLPEK